MQTKTTNKWTTITLIKFIGAAGGAGREKGLGGK